jgi:hypothetical protein
MTSENSSTAANKLASLLNRLYKFPHNVDKLELLERVYGPTDSANAGYKDSKLTMWEKRGFTYWYNDLDLDNQRKVVSAILERYPDLEELL